MGISIAVKGYDIMIIGSHVSMSGKDMFLNSVKEAVSYGSDTFMVYTGAPQNTRRKEIEDLNIEAGWKYMKEHGIHEFIVHSPYIINLANTIKPETFELAVEFLSLELMRTEAMGSRVLVLHPGAHVGAGADAGITQIVKGLNEVLTENTSVYVALETMAGKGSEIGRSFEELAKIYDGVVHNDRLRVCFDTCHVNDAGYDIVNDFNGVIESFDRLLGRDQIAVFHLNDSKNPCGAAKDRHENLGFGTIGFDALNAIAHHPDFASVPKILESPYVAPSADSKTKYPPYKYEISMLRSQQFRPGLLNEICETHGI